MERTVDSTSGLSLAGSLCQRCSSDSRYFLRPGRQLGAGRQCGNLERVTNHEAPSETELAQTVERMELKLAALRNEEVLVLMVKYRELCVRFEKDLSASPRDLALAKASALMLVQAIAQQDDPA